MVIVPHPIRRNPRMKSLYRAFFALFAFSSLAGSSNANAGLLDFLFGNRNPAPVYAPRPAPGYMPMQKQSYSPRQYGEPRYRIRSARRAAAPARSETSAAETAPEDTTRNLKAIRELYAIANEQGFTAAFLRDSTLRTGDIVVTPTGIAVFEGERANSHRSNQFRPLARSRLRNRIDLARLQSASGFNAGAIAGATQEARTLTISRVSKRPPKASGEASEAPGALP